MRNGWVFFKEYTVFLYIIFFLLTLNPLWVCILQPSSGL